MNRLLNKVAIITGADGGICGKASDLFCKEGAKVVMVDIDPSVEEKCKAIVADGGDAIAIVADVSQPESWELILNKTIEKYGTVDICVNGAARFSLKGDWNVFPMEDFRLTMETNVNGLIYSYKTVLKYMIDHQIRGNFLNFSSSTALSWNGSGAQAYPMSKAAIKNATQNMVKSVSAKHGIRFNCLAPNYVWTPKSAHLYEDGSRYKSAFEASTPFYRLGMPEDSAWAMVYLCSDEAEYINGVCLPTDGGWVTCN